MADRGAAFSPEFREPTLTDYKTVTRVVLTDIDGTTVSSTAGTVDSHGSEQVVIYSAAGAAQDLQTAIGNVETAVGASNVGVVADDAAFTVGTTELVPVGALADETSTDSVNEGDYGAFRMSLDRVLYVRPSLTDSQGETVAASQTDQALGATGAAGDRLDGVLIVPATTAPGAVSIKDGAGGAITIFAGGTTTVVSFFVPLGVNGWISTSGAWKVTTGTNVSAIGFGRFT